MSPHGLRLRDPFLVTGLQAVERVESLAPTSYKNMIIALIRMWGMTI